MKILAVLSTMDLRYGLGCTPAWWQLLKGLYEMECEVTAIPYLGAGFETLWWKVQRNPFEIPSSIYQSLSRGFSPRGAGIRMPEGVISTIAQSTTRMVWIKHLRRVLHESGPYDSIVLFNVPINQIRGLPTELKREFDLTIVYYDGDMPSIMPETNAQRGFTFDYYEGADLTEFDLFLVNSEGAIGQLLERGARDVRTLHYAADPELFSPINCEKSWAVAFFGFGSRSREKWMTRMISEASLSVKGRFVVAGEGFHIPLGRAEVVGVVPTSRLRRFCCSSRLNLNITASTHTEVYGSSTARPFELAAMGCCIVSCPYDGMENWFTDRKEIWMLKEGDAVAEVYNMLLSDEDLTLRMGIAARERLIRDHTYKARAAQLLRYLAGIG